MSIMRKLTIRTLKKNPKRTLVTIVGIILATSLITAVANLAESFRASMILYEREASGDFHYCFRGVAVESLKYFEKNANIEEMAMAGEVGYALLEGSKNPDKPYLYLYSMDERCREMAALKLSSGRWPEKEDEIVISSQMRSNGGSRLGIGDAVTLTMGVRTIGGTVVYQDSPYEEEEHFEPTGQKSYTVVGIMARPSMNVEQWTAPGYTAVTQVSDFAGKNASLSEPADRMTIFASYTKKGLKQREKVTAGLEPLAEGYRANNELLRFDTMYFSAPGHTMGLLYRLAAIALVIIIVTGVFCIRNSFQISLTEKLRMYGMLSSVGTTSKQRRKLVYCEAFYLGLIGIPLGIAGGVLATFVLIKVCGELVRYAVDMTLCYAFSWLAIIVGGVLAAVTIYFSAMQSAGKAARLSPISAIRSNATVRRGSTKLRTPLLVKKIFGIGGVLAYKNLKRSQVKYRTTVVSIVVSVAVFVSMTTFVRLGFKATRGQYDSGNYPIVVTLQDEERMEQAAQICSWDEVQEATVLRRAMPTAPAEQIPCTKESLAVGELGYSFGQKEEYRNGGFRLWVCAMGEESYEKYCQEVGISPAEAAQGAIIYAEFRVGINDGSGMKYYEGTIADFERGSVLELDDGVCMPVVCQTKVQPQFIRGRDSAMILCIVRDAWLDENLADCIVPQLDLYIQCEDADAMETRVRGEVPLYSFYVSNYERRIKEERNFWLLLAIFLYGFITVIALIGVTNIFNTVTTNMELRSREFAMLKSVGMTGREFRRMIQLESVFYGGGALCIGIPIGCILSRGFYLVLIDNLDMPYEPPLLGIGISIVAVSLLLFVIMRYSMGRINQKNIVETIQNENI